LRAALGREVRTRRFVVVDSRGRERIVGETTEGDDGAGIVVNAGDRDFSAELVAGPGDGSLPKMPFACLTLRTDNGWDAVQLEALGHETIGHTASLAITGPAVTETGQQPQARARIAA